MDLLSDLNQPQREAVQHVEGPLLVLAGAGSGKTRVITRRVAYMIQSGVPAYNILAITFTNKAAGELRERLIQLRLPAGVTACTFHSLCARLLREFAAEAELAHNYSIYDRDDQIRVVKAAMANLSLPTDRFPPARVHHAISSAKSDLVTPQKFADDAQGAFERMVAQVYAEYQRLLAGANALDFDDLLSRTARLMTVRPDVRQLLADRYRYIMVDEYQDTNRVQYILAHGIAVEHENICVTGDPDQSIYAWRGADVRNILEFEADYPNATVINLEENYRSARPILTAASALIDHNTQRKPKTLWTSRDGGEDVHVVVCDDSKAEAKEVARRVADFCHRGGRYDEVAVFYRVNSLSRTIEEAMLAAGIPYCVVRGVAFYNRKEIKDVLAYMKLLVNPDDEIATLRVINIPARGIGAVTVGRLLQLSRSSGINLLEACRCGQQAGLSSAAAKKTAAFAAMIESLAGDVDRSIQKIMEDVLSKTGLEKAFQAVAETAAPGAGPAANVAELISNARDFDESSGGAPLEEYLHQITLVSDVDYIEGGDGAVTLMTLHAAKGLEFPAVFIIGCEEGLLPFQRGDAGVADSVRPADLEEERRLAFVGMTRAKRELTLSSVRRRMLRGQYTSQTASRFLEEIGTKDVTHEDRTMALPQPRRQGSFSGGGFYAASDQEQIEALAEATQLPPELEYMQVGSKIQHPKFGRGKVTSIGGQLWPETRVHIFFEDFGPKTIKASVTNLELL